MPKKTLRFPADKMQPRSSKTKVSEELMRYRHVVEASPDPIVLHDATGCVSYVNRAFEETFFLDATSVIGLKPGFIPDEFEDQYAVIRSQVARGETVSSLESKRLNGMDMELDVIISAAPIFDSDGVFAGHVEYIKDVTDIRLVESTLRSANDRYMLLLATSPDPIVVYDAAGGVSMTNPAFEDVLGYDPDRLRGSELDFVPDESAEETGHALAEVIEGKNVAYETRRITADGRVLDMLISAAPFLDARGDMVGRTEILRDITEKKLAERALEKMNSQLVAANERMQKLDRVKNEFLSNVSHELRTPLTAIRGFAEMIALKMEATIAPNCDQNDSRVAKALSKVNRNAGIILSESDRLTALINNVLDISKMEAGKVEWKALPVSIAKIIQTASAVAAPLAEAKGLAFRIEAPDDLPEVIGDHDRLVQVVINLLSNAIKFTDKGEVVCRASSEADSLTVSVRDTGTGIHERDHEAVFDQFKQVGDSLVNKPQGTGLGLPICRQIVTHHGGEITLQSTPGAGSTFSMILPLPGAAASSGLS